MHSVSREYRALLWTQGCLILFEKQDPTLVLRGKGSWPAATLYRAKALCTNGFIQNKAGDHDTVNVRFASEIPARISAGAHGLCVRLRWSCPTLETRIAAAHAFIVCDCETRIAHQGKALATHPASRPGARFVKNPPCSRTTKHN